MTHTFEPPIHNAVKTPAGIMARTGHRYCTICKEYKPHGGTKAVAPWKCLDCKPRLVKK